MHSETYNSIEQKIQLKSAENLHCYYCFHVYACEFHVLNYMNPYSPQQQITTL